MKKEPRSPIPAVERYDGVFFRQFRKYRQQGKLPHTDLAIISPKKGILLENTPLPYEEPYAGKMGNLDSPDSDKQSQRNENLQQLNKILRRNYSEIYVNCGQQFLQLIEGYQTLTSAKITVAEGGGLGPKAAHMKRWIQEHAKGGPV